MDLVRQTAVDPGAKISIKQLMADMNEEPGPIKLQSDQKYSAENQSSEVNDDHTAADLKQFDDVLAFITEKPAIAQTQLKLSPDAAVTKRVQENQSIGPLPVFKSLDISATQQSPSSPKRSRDDSKFIKKILRQNFKQKQQLRQLNADTQKLYAIVNQLTSQNSIAQQNQRQYQENIKVQLAARFSAIEQQQAKLASTVKNNLIKVSAKINSSMQEQGDEKLSGQVDQLKQLIVQQSQATDSLRQQFTALQTRYAEQQQRNTELESTVNEQQEQITQLSEALRSVQSLESHDAQPFSTVAIENSLAVVQSAIDQQKQVNDNWQTVIDQLENRVDTKIEVMRSQIEMDNQQKSEQIHQKLRVSLQIQQQDQEKLRDLITKRLEAVEKQNQSPAGQQEQINIISQALEETKQNISRLQNTFILEQLDQNNSQILGKIESEIKSLQQQIQSEIAAERIENANQRADIRDSILKETQAQLQELQSNVSSQLQRFSEAQTTTLLDKLKLWNGQIEDLSKKQSQTDKNITSIQTTINSTVAEQQREMFSIKSLMGQLIDVDKNDKTDQQITVILKAIRKINEDNLSNAAQTEKVQQQLASAVALADNQREQIARLQDMYSQIQSKIQALQETLAAGHQQSIQSLRDALNTTVQQQSEQTKRQLSDLMLELIAIQRDEQNQTSIRLQQLGKVVQNIQGQLSISQIMREQLNNTLLDQDLKIAKLAKIVELNPQDLQFREIQKNINESQLVLDSAVINTLK